MNHKNKSVCFFVKSPFEQIKKEQYTSGDLEILRHLGYDVSFANKFGNLSWDCDIYFSWWASGSFIPLIAAKLRGKPIIVVAGGNEALFYRDSLSKEPKGYLAAPFYKRLATRLTLKFSDYVLVVSEYMIKDVLQLGAREVQLIPNAVDISQFSSTRKEIEGIKNITSIFRLEKSTVELKRAENLIRAFAIVLIDFPNQILKIIGSKEDAYQDLLKLCEFLRISKNVHFIGSVDNSKVSAILNETRVYVQPSDTETFGVAVAEAMCAGIPVVCSKTGGLMDLVGEDGVYIDQNSPDSIAQGIVKVLALKKNEYLDLSEKLRNRVTQKFNRKLRGEKLERIIKELIK